MKQVNFIRCVFLFLFLGTLSANIDAKTWYVGILAPRGIEAAENKWNPWLNHLHTQWLNEQFILVPLNLAQLNDAAHDSKLDFILAPQTGFLSIQQEMPLRLLANLESANTQNVSAGEEVGTAIWVNQNADIQNIADLRHKKIAAVAENAFGGYLLGYKLLQDASLREKQDYQIVFTGYPIDQVLIKLQQQEVDAAIAPVCLMEEMQQNNAIQAKQFRLLNPVTIPSNCASSSHLLPSWALAALPSVPNALAKHMSQFLLSPQPQDMPQWTPPVTSQAAEDVLRAIYQHPDQRNILQSFHMWLRQNYWLVGSALVTLLLLLLNTAWMSILAHQRQKKLRKAYRQVRDYEELMAQADRMNLLGEMASGIAHEINQPLAVIQSYADGSLLRLQKIDNTEGIQQAQRKIIEQVLRSVDIIQNLRAFSKPQIQDQFQDCILHANIEKCIQFFHIQHKQHSLLIENQVPKDLVFHTSPSILEQVLMNCLLNSKQQKAQNIVIQVQALPKSKAIQLNIMDDAGGFSQERLDFPFVPFKSSKPTGLGLGLVICERLLLSIGASLQLSNRQDGICGACVSIVLTQNIHRAGK